MVPLDSVPPEHPDNRRPSPRDLAASTSDKALVQRAIASLPADQREIVWMHYLEDLDKGEIARRLEMHPSTVGRQLRKAVERLRRDLNGTDAPVQSLASSARPTAMATTAIVAAALSLSPAAKAALTQAASDTGILAGAAAAQPVATNVVLGHFSKLLGSLAHPTAALVAGSVCLVAISMGFYVHRSRSAAEKPSSRGVRITASRRPTVSRYNPQKTTADPGSRISAAARAAANLPHVTRPGRSDMSGLIKPEDLTTSHPTFAAGQVVDTTGAPIAGAFVDPWTWYERGETYTDANGFFRLERLDPGERPEVRITKEGYTPYYNPRHPLGVTTEPIVLGNSTWLEGTVYGADGKPAVGASIRTDMGRQEADGVSISHVWSKGTADQAGHYCIYLPASMYSVEAKVGNDVAVAERVAVNRGQATRLDLHLKAGIAFRALLVDSLTSAPVPGVELSNWQRPGISAHTDENGVAEILGLGAGKLELEVKARGYARWWTGIVSSAERRPQRDGANVIGLGPAFQRDFDDLTFDLKEPETSVTITIEKAAVIRGIVLDPDGHPVEGATVSPAKTGSGNSITGDTRFSFKTQPGGRFTAYFPASFEDEYNLVAHDGKFDEQRRWANGVGPVMHTFPGEEWTTVTLRLTRPCQVSGLVVNEEGKPQSYVSVQSTSANRDENRYYLPHVKTDDKGQFILGFVPPGKQYIMIGEYSFAPGPNSPANPPQTWLVHYTRSERRRNDNRSPSRPEPRAVGEGEDDFRSSTSTRGPEFCAYFRSSTKNTPVARRVHAVGT